MIHNVQNIEDPTDLERIWRPVFDKYDTDKDGRILLDHFKNVLTSANYQLKEDVPKEVLDEILERAKWDIKRYITFNDFIRMIHAQQLGSHKPRLHRLIRYASLMVIPKSQRESTINRYFEEYNCNPPPFFIFIISLMEIIVFAYYCVKMDTLTATGPVPFDSVLIYNPYKRSEIWRYLTYALIHAGFFHIFFNIVVQLLLGIPLELVHKGWRIGLLYLCGCFAGSLCSSITDPRSFLVGASGGVYALIAAHLANVVINYKEMEYGIFRVLILIFFGTTDVAIAIYDRYSADSKNRTSYSAHFMGALTGFLLGVIALRNLRIRKWELILQWITGIIWILLMIICIIWNIAYDNYFPQSE